MWSIARFADIRKYNLHCHTQFCDGRSSMREFVDAALGQGFEAIGFTPHSPVPIESPCNMSREDVAVYLAEIERLRDYAAGRLDIFAGMEVDYLGQEWGPSNSYISSLPLDYIIGSVHFIPDQNGQLIDIDGRFSSFRRKMHSYFDNDIRYVVNTFFTRSIEMVEAGGFDIMGHLDKVGRNASLFAPGIEDEPWYCGHVETLIDAIASRGSMAVEINTKVTDDTGRTFPRERWFTRLLRAGIPIVVNSDSHYADKLSAGRQTAFTILHTAREALCR